MSAERPRLYFTADRTRFFLVPRDLEIPPGDLVLRTLQATSVALDEAALAAHEVDAEAARAHVDTGWERVIGQDLAGFLGVTPGEMAVDPNKRKEARRNLLRKASGLLRSGGWDDAELDQAEARLDRAGEVVRRDAEKLAEGAGQLGKALEDAAPGIERAVSEAGTALADLLRGGRKSRPPGD